jgi:hypothetical protein
MIKSPFYILLFVFISSSCANKAGQRQQIKSDSLTKSIPADTTDLPHFPDSLLLVSGGQMSPFKTVNIDNINFQLVKNSKGDTSFVGTWDKSFQTPEGYQVGTSLQQIKKTYRDKLQKEPGWGYFIELPSKWSLQFFVEQTATDHVPADTHKVTYVFKRH